MDEEERQSILSRKELRRQKLMEYLAAKGKLKLPNPKPYLRDDSQIKKTVTSAPKSAKGKENKIPAAVGLRNEGTKIHAAQSISQPPGRLCGLADKMRVKSGSMTGQQTASRPNAPTGPLQRKHTENPALTRTHTLASSKPSLSANSQFKTQQKAGGRSLSNAAAHTRSRNSSCRRSAQSAAQKTVCGRISLGPLVKTKTGLIPAAIQPRNVKSSRTCSSATAADAATSLTSRGRSAVTQKYDTTRRKTFSATSANKPTHDRTAAAGTARAEVKIQDQTKSCSKPLLIKRPEPSQTLSTGQKPRSVSSKYTAPPVRPDRRERTSKSVKWVVQPTSKTSEQRRQTEAAGNGQTRSGASRTSSAAASRCGSRTTGSVPLAAVAEPGGKAKICKRTSANVPPPPTGTKRTVPVTSQTAPRPARTTSQSEPTGDTKTPKTSVMVFPQTDGQRPTAAQEQRMRKLQEWREAKGISYKRPPMPVKPWVRRTTALLQPFWTTMKEEEDAHSLICAVDRSLADCIKLLEGGCPSGQVKDVLSRLPVVSRKFAKFWICQARLMEHEGNLDVLPMFEEAVRVVLEPVDELRAVVFEILKKRDEIQASAEKDDVHMHTQASGTESSPDGSVDPLMTPKPVRALIYGENGDSSVVKYKITATPGNPKSQQKEPARVKGQEVRFFTPVRRSVRIERSSLRYPASLQDHDLCVTSYNDLIAKEEKGRNDEQEETSPSVPNTSVYVYRQNEALQDKVFVQLICDDDEVMNFE
ncbi:hypothetical protein LDENG_00190920 [Lucifuga dentata]|nr:hypothetical protein LDENG_00190920 [Lucifuga dentata]